MLDIESLYAPKGSDDAEPMNTIVADMKNIIHGTNNPEMISNYETYAHHPSL
jgi:hypothetical protein